MKNTLHFLVTAAISTGYLLAATKAPNPWPYFGIMDIYIMSFKKLIVYLCKKSGTRTI